MTDIPDAILERVIPELTQRLEQGLAKERILGLAVGIVRDQELVLAGGFGRANLQSERPPDERSLFRVASITKTFTAAAILQLRDDGRLSLDDPLHRFLPEFAAVRVRAGALDAVTLRRLLAHHSGLVTEAPLPGWDALQFPSLAEILAAIPDTEIVIPQDSAFKYSNLAYGLLGEVIARTAGMPYSEYLRTRILEPLKMRSSVLELTGDLRPRLAVGHYPHRFDDGYEVAPYKSLNGIAACGQLHTSVEDLAHWVSLQFRAGETPRSGMQILRGATIDESHRPQYLESDWSVGYCLGWRATRVGDRVYHGHGGGIHGYASYVLFSKRYKLGVICLANVWPHPGLLGLATEIAETIIHAAVTAPETRRLGPPAATPAEWNRLLGLYEATPGIYAAIAFRDGELRLEKTALSDYLLHAPAVLEPAGGATFVVRGGRGAGERVEFQFGADDAHSFSLGGFMYRKLRHEH